MITKRLYLDGALRAIEHDIIGSVRAPIQLRVVPIEIVIDGQIMHYFTDSMCATPYNPDGKCFVHKDSDIRLVIYNQWSGKLKTK